MSILVPSTGGSGKFPTSIYIAIPPNKTEYKEGEYLDLTGMVVKAKYNNGTEKDITEDVTTEPNTTTPLTEEVTHFTVKYVYKKVEHTALQSITVEPDYEIVDWGTGTPEQIQKMLQAHYDGKIDIHDYWPIGATRTVRLSAMAAEGVDESHAEQDVELVLIHAGGFQFSDGSGECAFVVGQKDCLNETGRVDMETEAVGWRDCARRTWCNSTYREAFPSGIKAIFKEIKVTTGIKDTSKTAVTDDYFALSAEKEVFGKNTYGNRTSESSLFQLTYYKVASQRIKKISGVPQRQHSWYTRTNYGYDGYVSVDNEGESNSGWLILDAIGIAPFGCI